MPSAQPGFVIWFVGLPASGKSTLARTLQHELAQRAVHSVLLDSDELRRILTPQPTYNDMERDWFYGVVGEWAVWLAQNGINVLIAATANRRSYRDWVRARSARFAEVYVQCSLAVCMHRDPKGIYAQAGAGKAQQVPGLGSDFEPPLAPEAVVYSEVQSPQSAAEALLVQFNYLWKEK
jgi:adenylylsulfate kinase